MIELNRARNHLRQQWLENDVVLPIDERDFGLFQFARRKHLAEMDCDVNSAESAAENENALLCHRSKVVGMKSLLYQGASRKNIIGLHPSKLRVHFGGYPTRFTRIAHRTGDFGFVLPRRDVQPRDNGVDRERARPEDENDYRDEEK